MLKIKGDEGNFAFVTTHKSSNGNFYTSVNSKTKGKLKSTKF